MLPAAARRVGSLGGCDGDAELQRQTAARWSGATTSTRSATSRIFDLFRDRGDPERGVVVNRYLWQASLDILSFLPLEGADPFSGLIVTGWGRVGGAAPTG